MIRTPTVRSQADALNAFLAKAVLDTSIDMYMQGHMGKYACVVAAGFIENGLAETYCIYVAKRSEPIVSAFVCATLRKIQNPKSTKFLEVTRRFSKTWEQELQSFLDENSGKRKAAIDSIMTNRHLIAHGKNSNITLRQVKSYFDASIEVFEFIERKIY